MSILNNGDKIPEPNFYIQKSRQEIDYFDKRIKAGLLAENGQMKFSKGKLMFDLVHTGLAIPIRELAKILTFGAKKYAPNSWQGINPDEYWHALYRHLNAFKVGQVNDPESGLHHLSHALCNLAFLVYFELADKK